VAKSIHDVEAGDIISVYNRDYITDQVYKLGAGPAATVNMRLKDGSDIRWMAVRKQEGSDLLAMGEQVDLDAEECGEQLILENKKFNLVGEKSGRAIGTSSMGYPRYVNMDYYDYAAESGDIYLFVQKEPDSRVAFSGEAVINSAVIVYPKPK